MKRLSYGVFANRVIRNNRHFFDEDVQGFLDFIARSFPERVCTLPKDYQLWRAHLGYDTEPEIHDGEEYGEVSVPWGPTRMVPDATKVREGRANPRGIAYLYLSNSKETAMHEVRPWTGSVLSAAVFKTTQEQKLVDFSVFHGEKHPQISLSSLFEEPTEDQIQKDVWISVDNAFSEPVPNNEDPTKYIPTQIIAELVKREGYDGIAYKSVFSDGFNIVLFDVNAVSLIYCSMYNATDVKMSFCQEEGTYAEYWVNQKST